MLRRRVVLGTLAVTGALMLGDHAAAAVCAPWRTVSVPNIAGTLFGVAAHSRSDAMAVGDGGQHAFALRRGPGGPWRAVDVPARGSQSELSDVARVPGTDDYWAVGSFTTNAGAIRTHIVRWTGSKWIVVPSPYVSNFRSTLRGVTALSTTNAWAVGSFEILGRSARTLVLRWNGTSWRIVDSPSPLHPSATFDVPIDHLNDVIAVSPGNLWTAGDMSYEGADEDRRTFILRRQAPTWQTSFLPQQGFEDTLESISALSPRDIWTVGWTTGPTGTVDPLTFHWNGQAWSRVAVPARQPGQVQTYLYGVESLSPSKTWAVGQEDVDLGIRAMVLRWNGTVWRTVSNPGAPHNSFLRDVARVPGSEVTWAVGGLLGVGGVNTPLIQRHC